MILLDSHVIIWLALTPERISVAAAKLIALAQDSGEGIAISAATIYELEYAIRRGRILLAVPQRAIFARIQSRFRVLSITAEIASFAAQIPEPFHGDPFDRLIAATAVVENCSLISADRKIIDATVCKTVW
jgi:PIN domain nuclease of toxin-antitoxin system